MVESRGLHGPRARDSGLQPLRRGAPADARDDGRRSTCCSSICRTSAAASTPSSRRCATCSRRRRGTARRSGCSIGRIPSAGPIEGLRCAPGWESFVGAGPLPMRHGLTMGELAHWFVATLGLERRLPRRRDARAGSPTPRPATAGRSASALGSIRARTCRCWRRRAAIPARSWSRARRCPKAAARRGRSSSSARPISTREALHRRRCARSRRSGCAAAGCARAGSSRRSRSTSASCAPACRSTSRTARTITRRFGRGACRRSRSRRCARSSRSIRCGATSPTSTSAAGSRSTCINGSDLLRRWVDDRRSTPDDLDALALADEKAWPRRAPAVPALLSTLPN